jgi:hypothetical protein
MDIEGLAHDFSIRRRTLFDFVRICSIFGICARFQDDRLKWFGIEHSKDALDSVRADADEKRKSSEMKDTFSHSLDQSLLTIALGFVKLFFYLRVKSLDLRKVSRLFAQRRAKYKTTLRKIYTVAGALAVLGFVRKTAVAAEIQLSLPLKSCADSESGLGLSSILNSPQELEDEQACVRRRRDFELRGAEAHRSRKTARLPAIG